VEKKDARVWAINMRWDFLQVIREVLLHETQTRDRVEQFHNNVFSHDPAVLELATARLHALGAKLEPPAVENTSNGEQQPVRRVDRRRLNKRQRKIISPDSFLPSRLSGIRDVIFELLSLPQNSEGLTVEDMEEPIRLMLQAEGFLVPSNWVLIQFLRATLSRQTHHLHMDRSGRWTATQIPARQLSRPYLNFLRSEKCHPSRGPLETPALLHIFIQRHSSAIGVKQLKSSEPLYEATAKAVDAAFGRRKQQPETSPYRPSPYNREEPHNNYPMRIKCLLPNVQGTTSLLDMLHMDADCKAALEELSEYARQTLQDNPRHRGPFIYRIIILGRDGGSCNNDSFLDMKEAYPRLDGQLLMIDDNDERSGPIICRKPMMDFMQPVCLLPAEQRKDHKHVLWSMFDISMLADEWSPTRQQQIAPELQGSRTATWEHHQQILACRKLLLSNSLMYYHRVDCSMAAIPETADFIDPDLVRNQTHNGRIGSGRNNESVVDRCTPQSGCFDRTCTWCGQDTIISWTLTHKPPVKGEPLLRFVCDRYECYLREVEESAPTTILGTANGPNPSFHKGSKSSKTSSSDDQDDDRRKPRRSEKSNEPRVVGEQACRFWHGRSIDNRRNLLLDPLIHDSEFNLSDYDPDVVFNFFNANYPEELGAYDRNSFKLRLLARHRALHEADTAKSAQHDKIVNDSPVRPQKPIEDLGPRVLGEQACRFWRANKTNTQRNLFLDPLIHDSEFNMTHYDFDAVLAFFIANHDEEMTRAGLKAILARHQKSHEVDTAKSAQHDKIVYDLSTASVQYICPLWPRQNAKYKVLDPLIHDAAGNFIDVPLDDLLVAIKANAMHMKKRDLQLLVASHKDRHTRPPVQSLMQSTVVSQAPPTSSSDLHQKTNDTTTGGRDEMEQSFPPLPGQTSVLPLTPKKSQKWSNLLEAKAGDSSGQVKNDESANKGERKSRIVVLKLPQRRVQNHPTQAKDDDSSKRKDDSDDSDNIL
jgi:hypothetical protein